MYNAILSPLEPMGYMLYNERMLETYIYARKWLKKGGKMFPSTGTLYLAPFSDESLFQVRTTHFERRCRVENQVQTILE